MVKINLFRMRQLMRQIPRKLWQIEQVHANIRPSDGSHPPRHWRWTWRPPTKRR